MKPLPVRTASEDSQRVPAGRRAPGRLTPASAGALGLQQLAGNHAVVALLQRQPEEVVVTARTGLHLRQAEVLLGQLSSIGGRVGRTYARGERLQADFDIADVTRAWVRALPGPAVDVDEAEYAVRRASVRSEPGAGGARLADEARRAPRQPDPGWVVDGTVKTAGTASAETSGAALAYDDLATFDPNTARASALQDAVDAAGVVTPEQQAEYGRVKPLADKVAHDRAVYGAVMSGGDTLAGIFQGIQAVRSFQKFRQDRRAGDLFDAASGTVIAGATFGLGVTEAVVASQSLGPAPAPQAPALVANGPPEAISLASSVGSYFFTVGEAFAVLKAGILAVKDAWVIYRDWDATTGVSRGRTLGDLLGSTLAVARSAVSNVKHFLDFLGGGATQELFRAIPALGLALSGVKIALKTWDLIVSGLSRSAMTVEKRLAKRDEAGTYRDWYRNAKLQAGQRGLTKHQSIEALRTSIEMDELGLGEGLDLDADERAEYLGHIKRYETARALNRVNVKRQNRAGMAMGVELVNVAGEISTLSGVGAIAGVPLKAAASGTGILLSVLRGVKQFGRDQAAMSSSEFLRSLFTADKSTVRKLEERQRHADVIFELIAEIDAPSPAGLSPAEAHRRRLAQVNVFVSAAGCDEAAFWAAGDGRKMWEMLVKAQAKRD